MYESQTSMGPVLVWIILALPPTDCDLGQITKLLCASVSSYEKWR